MSVEWSLVSNFFLALLAIINPFGKIPLWVDASFDDRPGVRTYLALLTVVTGGTILIAMLVFGQHLLNLFGLNVSTFKIGGGIVVLIAGIRMMDGTIMTAKRSNGGEEYLSDATAAKDRFRNIVVPMVIPMTAGPVSITTALIYGVNASTVAEFVSLSAVVAGVMVVVFAVLISAHRIRHWVGSTPLDVQTRLFGLILCAVAAQLMVEGLGEVFPGWLAPQSQLQENIQTQNPQ